MVEESIMQHNDLKKALPHLGLPVRESNKLSDLQRFHQQGTGSLLKLRQREINPISG